MPVSASPGADRAAPDLESAGGDPASISACPVRIWHEMPAPETAASAVIATTTLSGVSRY
ncbi:MAG TPA: hypothetical protein VMB21_04485 [Candidatus Limnocylindria bacterium]|nr:hypothetical protein [Candidatus Limnocylindria bacterium]